MSDNELHTGKFKKIGKVSQEWIEKEILIDDKFEVNYGEGFEDGRDTNFIRRRGDDTDDYREKITHLYHKGVLYEMVSHVEHDDAYSVNSYEVFEDGTVSFTYMFYNGGTCLEEHLEETLEELEDRDVYEVGKYQDEEEIQTDDFYYDLTMGGYIKPEEILVDKKRAAELNKAIDLLEDWRIELEADGKLDYL